MTLTEAIKIAGKSDFYFWPSYRQEDIAALKLLSKAGKEIKCLRRDGVLGEEHLLPGEKPE